jgi:hypothetical protein
MVISPIEIAKSQMPVAKWCANLSCLDHTSLDARTQAIRVMLFL